MEAASAKIFASLLVGYLLGSVSPAYILGKVLGGIDIRQHGTGNAGTTNVYHLLGLRAALPTALYDLSKGILALLFARVLGLPPFWGYAAAALAVVGHIFPFYLQFKGGQGVGTATGLMLYFLARFYGSGSLPWHTLLILLAQALIFYLISRTKEVIGKTVLPLLLFFIHYYLPLNPESGFISLIIVFIFGMGIYNIVVFRLIDIPRLSQEIIWWRFFMRPLAVLFPLLYIRIGKESILVLIGMVALVFILLDLLRLSSRGINIVLFRNVRRFFKESERQKFSSMSLFLIASFVTILIFPQPIALLALLYLTLGDMFGKFFGLQFGRRRFLGKTIEGSLAHLAGCLLAGYIFSLYYNGNAEMPLTPFFIVVGSIAATIAEASPTGVDDNLIVPLISASVMMLPAIL